MKRPSRLTAFFASCFGLLAVPALAWEWNYGPPTTFEDGFRRVHPVPSCGPAFPNAGYIAIGTQDIGGLNPDVYVVYTNLAGGPGWEMTYDVQGLGLVDEGMAIVSVPNQGYVLLSNSFTGAWQPALTFINCKGVVMWSQVYPDLATGQDLWGNDLIRTQSGDPAFGTAPGDYAVAGWWRNGGNRDAFLLRTDANGLRIWDSTYDNQGLDEVFNALIEALPAAPALAGDLVAAGQLITTANDPQGLAARVDGNNGAIGGGLQCMQHHGQAGSAETYNSLTRLQVNFAGQFAFVGTTNAAGLDDIWVNRGNTCPLTLQARVGNPPGAPPTAEQGNDIIEVQVPKPGGTLAGYLAIAGHHIPAAGGVLKAAMAVVNLNFIPVGGLSRLFGIPAPNAGTFFSLAEDPAGWPVAPPSYVFAGLTQATVVGPDPQDMYLVHQNNPGAVGLCEQVWTPTRVQLNWPQVDLLPWRSKLTQDIRVDTPYWDQSTGIRTCP